MAVTFTENWFKERSCAVLARLVGEVAAVPGRIIEVGSWEGRSTLAIANATTRVVHAVDTWKGSPIDGTDRLAAARDVRSTFLANTAHVPHVKPFHMDWRDYHASHDGQIALVFLDAEHTYWEVTAQIDAFRPLMAEGGIICGDDRTHPPVWTAATDRLGDVNAEQAVWWWTNAP
jgi:predicted O-methyltransferase YrrM